MKLREAINDIKTGVVHPVYFLKGNDHFLQNFLIDELAKEIFDNHDPKFYEPLVKRDSFNPMVLLN